LKGKSAAVFGHIASDCWDIWFKDDVTGGEVTVTADINAMTWKYE
jgi:hypothetical protein